MVTIVHMCTKHDTQLFHLPSVALFMTVLICDLPLTCVSCFVLLLPIQHLQL